MTGLLAGIIVWTVLLLLPLLSNAGLTTLAPDLYWWQNLLRLDHWSLVTFSSLTINTLLFVLVSMLHSPSESERRAAAACRREPATLPERVHLTSAEQFEAQLGRMLGPEVAQREVRQALADLELDANEQRPTELGLLRERIERNLSGLLGPQMAHMIVTEGIALAPHEQHALGDTIRHVEARLEASRSRLRGLAAQLDTLRRYHRQVLHELPLGVCSVSPEHKVVIWNTAMTAITRIEGPAVTDQRIEDLPNPWAGMLRTFLQGEGNHLYKLQVTVMGQPRWFNLHKSTIDPSGPDAQSGFGGTVILVEDLTGLHTLEREVAHADRLASIGRLAAGVAHEIGNPLAGIASLAQNLRYETDPGEIDESLEAILEQTRRITRIVQSLVNFSHAGESGDNRLEPLNPRDAAEDAIGLIQLDRQAEHITINNRIPATVSCAGDRQRLTQVFINLLSNAIDASGPDGRIDLRARLQDNDQLRIEIEDQGNGIDEALIDQIFEPFFTTKPAGKGTGLGLSLVYSIVQDHDGQVFIETPATGGTRVVILLPA